MFYFSLEFDSVLQILDKLNELKFHLPADLAVKQFTAIKDAFWKVSLFLVLIGSGGDDSISGIKPWDQIRDQMRGLMAANKLNPIGLVDQHVKMDL